MALEMELLRRLDFVESEIRDIREAQDVVGDDDASIPSYNSDITFVEDISERIDDGDILNQYFDIPTPTGGESLPDCTELPSPLVVAAGPAFPYRFKKTSDAGGVVQWESLDNEELPLIVYRNAFIYYTALQTTGGFPVNGAITIANTGTTRCYLTCDLTIKTSSAWQWVSTSSYTWAQIDDAHDYKTEIIPILTIKHTSSVIEWWVQHQWGTVRMPSNA